MGDAETYYLVKDDVEGDRHRRLLGSESVRVLKGEIGKMTDDQPGNDCILKLRIVDRNDVTVLCEIGVVSVLSAEDAALLRGVRTNNARYEMFRTGRLAEVRSIEQGAAVSVQTSKGEFLSGYVQYRGELSGKPGIIFGVELLEDPPPTVSEANSDGDYNGERYFRCPKRRGMFVQPNRITLNPRAQGDVDALIAQRYGSQQAAYMVTSDKNLRSSKRSSRTDQVKLHENMRVVAMTDDGVPKSGTIRWLGFMQMPPPDGKRGVSVKVDVAGLEMDEPIDQERMEGLKVQRSVWKMIKAPVAQRLFRQVDTLIPEEVMLDTSTVKPVITNQPRGDQGTADLLLRESHAMQMSEEDIRREQQQLLEEAERRKAGSAQQLNPALNGGTHNVYDVVGERKEGDPGYMGGSDVRPRLRMLSQERFEQASSVSARDDVVYVNDPLHADQVVLEQQRRMAELQPMQRTLEEQAMAEGDVSQGRLLDVDQHFRQQHEPYDYVQVPPALVEPANAIEQPSDITWPPGHERTRHHRQDVAATNQRQVEHGLFRDDHLYEVQNPIESRLGDSVHQPVVARNLPAASGHWLRSSTQSATAPTTWQHDVDTTAATNSARTTASPANLPQARDPSVWKPEVGSHVEASGYRGVIRWIGNVDAEQFRGQVLAGIELDGLSPVPGDGMFMNVRYFFCEPGHALFTKLSNCKEDKHFSQTTVTQHQAEASSVTASSTDRVTEQDILVVVEYLQQADNMRDWRKLARQAGLDRQSMSRFIKDPHDDYQCVLDILWYWQHAKPEQEPHELVSFLKEAGFPRVAERYWQSHRKAQAQGQEGTSSSQGYRRIQVQEAPPSVPVRGEWPARLAITDDFCGDFHGIQGDFNSCYMDAALFAMFAFTNAFDAVLLRAAPHGLSHNERVTYEKVQTHLRENIVNPLRCSGYVSHDHITTLRTMFDQLNRVAGLKYAEKDPEEFLNLMWQHVFKTKPFLQLTSHHRDDTTYIYQLFVEADPAHPVPTVQRLMEQSFLDGQVLLAEMPSVLVLQMPRFGKDFKTFDKIMPTLTLSMTNVLKNGCRKCVLCGKRSTKICEECRRDGIFRHEVSVSLCDACCSRVHETPTSVFTTHHPADLADRFADGVLEENYELVRERETMELVAVLCIQISHYVAFVKCGEERDAPWCLFDSMHNRVGDPGGFNIPNVQRVHDFYDWVRSNEAGLKHVRQTPLKSMPEAIRRLFSDSYMCFYQSHHNQMYG